MTERTKPTSKPVKKLVSRCPFCGRDMTISRLTCHGCDTQIDSQLAVPPFFRLPDDLQEFVMTFLRCRGSIRDVEKELGISYPTVCKRLDAVNELLGNRPAVSSQDILGRLERGEISAKVAAQLLKERDSR
ncbi:MAG: DUF2089 domain-containing protein [Planctomycetota bacterium]|nr:DUF2089 domain-containing protein [Planctomycetota bacterium]